MSSVPEMFGSLVFNDDVMREKLPKDVYKSLRKTIDRGTDLDINAVSYTHLTKQKISQNERFSACT